MNETLIREMSRANEEICRLADFLVGYGDAAELVASRLRKLSRELEAVLDFAEGEQA